MAIRSLSAVSAPKQNTSDATTAVASRSTRPASIAKRLLATGCLGLAVVSSTGCTLISRVRQSFDQSECIDDFMIGYRNKVMAEKAWHCNKHRFCDQPFANEFKEGFIAGYIDVASGGNGCTPAVAPPSYWGWRYQSPQGQSALNTWFAGFPHGAQAAEQDGVGHWQSIISMEMNPATSMPVHTPINSGDDGVANPFYSEPQYVPEYVPAPQPSERSDPQTRPFQSSPIQSSPIQTSPFEDDVSLDEAESIFNQPQRDFPVEVEISDEDPELVSQLEVAMRHEPAIAATLSDQMEEAPETAAAVIDDIFGSSAPTYTDSDSEELPFSFE